MNKQHLSLCRAHISTVTLRWAQKKQTDSATSYFTLALYDGSASVSHLNLSLNISAFPLEECNVNVLV